jgi:hypothetical protein
VGSTDFFVAKVSSTGQFLWVNKFGNGVSDVFSDLKKILADDN